MKFCKLYSVLLPLLLILLPQDLVAQSDSISFESSRRSHTVNPLKSTMLAAAFPGMGQIYNRKYWKVPFVYAGFGAVGYSIVFNTQNFNKFLSGYLDLTDDIAETTNYIDLIGRTPYTAEQIDHALGSEDYDPQVGSWVEDQLLNAVDYYRRYRDLSYIGMAVWYMITIIDANVDANLSDFDIGESLQVKIEPMPVQTVQGYGMGVGVKVIF